MLEGAKLIGAGAATIALAGAAVGIGNVFSSLMCGASHLKPDDAKRPAGAPGSNPTSAYSSGEAMPRSLESGLFNKCRWTNLDNGRSYYELGFFILITGCRPYSSTPRINGEREPLGRNEQSVVTDLRRLGLESTIQAGRVGKDDSYKDGTGDRNTHLGMNGKPATERGSGNNDYLDFYLSEECSSGFFSQKEAGAACLAKLTNLTRGPNGKFENLIEIISDYNVLIAAYQKLKSKPGNMTPGEGPAEYTPEGLKEDTPESINPEWFRKAQESLTRGSYVFQQVGPENLPKPIISFAFYSPLRVRERYAFLLANLWALRTKKREAFYALAFYGNKKLHAFIRQGHEKERRLGGKMQASSMQAFSLDFFLAYRITPKAKLGESRPLTREGDHLGGDLIVQEAMHMTLERIYEPLFSNSSHGFRPSRGCHTALEEIKNTRMEIPWLLEFDIRKCYDTIDRHRLVSIIQEEIHDQRFMDLILKLFKAEVIDDYRVEPLPKAGVLQQDSVMSPLPCNIYPQKLDQEIDRIQQEHKNTKAAHKHKKKSGLFCRALPLLHKNYKDPSLIKVRYVRYADEFLLGIAGSRDLVERIQERITQFLKSDLHLEVGSASYVHIASGSVIFLGMELALPASRWPRRFSRGIEKRRRSKTRINKWAEIRKESWDHQLKDLTLCAWTWALRKTRHNLSSWGAAEHAMSTKARRVARDFLLEKIDRGETRQSVQHLLSREKDVFPNISCTGIPEEILQAHTHLTRLLEKYLDDEFIRTWRNFRFQKNIQKNMDSVFGVRKSIATNTGRRVSPMRILAPMEVITEKLRNKGILQPTQARPTTLTSMLNYSDEAIVSYYSALAHGLLSYYRCCDNFHLVRRLVDYQVRWSALFTLASKHRCSTKKVIVKYTRGPQALSREGEVIAKYPGSPTIARMGKRFLTDIRQDAVDDVLPKRLEYLG
uniref:Mat-atp9i95g2c n=1 Tax=Phylloglossum drummondii TaxID=70003 RepID=UPI003002A16E|nr:Mat-atp9i95g2c [Phylloglossum drummondii]